MTMTPEQRADYDYNIQRLRIYLSAIEAGRNYELELLHHAIKLNDVIISVKEMNKRDEIESEEAAWFASGYGDLNDHLGKI